VNEPEIAVSVHIACAPDAAWRVVADPSRLAELSPEASAARAATEGPLPAGARFSGSNRNGLFRWSTSCVVVESVPGSAFAFDVTFLGLDVSRWRYDVRAVDGGCDVAEQWWDHRGFVMRTLGALGTGVKDRQAHNTRTMTDTLAALKADLEASAG
jgi:hypothetical protein